MSAGTAMMLHGILLFIVLASVQGAQFNASNGVYTASHPETAPAQGIGPPDGVILTVQCTNTNSSGDDPLESATYSITGDGSYPFMIDETTGELSWRPDQLLDYENVTFYEFDVLCIDNSDVNNRAAAIVNVSVLPVNEYAPSITNGLTSVISIGEDTPIGTVILSTEPRRGLQQYGAEDADDGTDGQIIFTLSNQSDSDFLQLFELNHTSGAVSVAQRLFRASNSPSVLNGSIIICDTDPPRVECPDLAVTVILTLPGAMFDPMFNRSQLQVTLPESAELGTPVASAVCFDDDLGLGAFAGINIQSVTPDTYADVFGLNSTEDGHGILWLRQPLDYDTLQTELTISVILRCFDNQPTPREDFAAIIVTILPVNDNTPQFSQDRYEFTVNIANEEESLCCLEATDGDRDIGNQITYSLEDIQGRFTIQSNGEITFDASMLSDQVGVIFVLMATASDGEFDTTASVLISVTEDAPSTIRFGVVEIAIVASVCGGAVLLSAMVGLICCCYLCLSNRRSKSKEEAAKEKKSAKTKAANKKSKVSKKKPKDHIDYTDDGVINIQFIPDP